MQIERFVPGRMDGHETVRRSRWIHALERSDPAPSLEGLAWYCKRLTASRSRRQSVKDGLPLLEHALDEPTAFSPDALMEAVRAERHLSREPIPQVCVLELDGDLTD